MASGGLGAGGQSQRSTSDGGGGGVPDQYAAAMAQAAPQLRALRIDSEAPAAGGPGGVRTRISPPDMQVVDMPAVVHADPWHLQCKSRCVRIGNAEPPG